MTQCLSPCPNCSIMVTVLIEVSQESDAIGPVAYEIMEECDFDDVSITFRINGVDQAVRCPQKALLQESYDDCLF